MKNKKNKPQHHRARTPFLVVLFGLILCTGTGFVIFGGGGSIPMVLDFPAILNQGKASQEGASQPVSQIASLKNDSVKTPTQTLTLLPSMTQQISTTLPPDWTATPSPTATPLPTDTPQPTKTPTLYFTPVPMVEGPIVIGYSVNDLPIEAFRVGVGPVKRMIVAGIHGGYEWNTVALADEMIAYLWENSGIVPQTVTLYIVRSLNPDGFERSTGFAGRTNENGVDLNRNYPAHWKAEWERRGCWNYLPITSGESPASEPETKALMDFILEVRPTALISYHSAALGIFPAAVPDDINKPHPDSYELAETLARVSRYPFPPVQTGCEYTGTLADWAASQGIAAVDLELHTHEFADFRENLLVLEAFLAWRR